MSTTSPPADGTLRVPGAAGRPVTLTVDGRPVEAVEGESVLAALWAAGIRALHRTALTGEPRALLCGIGVCFDCLVTVEGERSTRACMTPVTDGMTVTLQLDAGWEGHGHEAA
jgi:predicted molibdopterin-dependent oxidoreductase YjgC